MSRSRETSRNTTSPKPLVEHKPVIALRIYSMVLCPKNREGESEIVPYVHVHKCFMCPHYKGPPKVVVRSEPHFPMLVCDHPKAGD